MTKHRLFIIMVIIGTLAVPMAAYAGHAWGNYHWGRTSNPFTLKAHDNVTSNWEPYLQEAAQDWSRSTVLDVDVLWGSPLSSARKCSSTAGRIEVCNLKYGNNGWLGIAGISISGSHITKAYTKLNDSYFSTATYDTPAWRRMVTCQEIAHDFGLDHQDETFANANLGSCMDYTNDPDGGAGGASSNDPSNEHPNNHDFDMIEQIYAHLDSVNTYSSVIDTWAESLTRPQSIQEILAGADQWGAPVKFNADGLPTLFVMPGVNHDDREYTHVFWAPEDPFTDRRDANGPGRSN